MTGCTAIDIHSVHTDDAPAAIGAYSQAVPDVTLPSTVEFEICAVSACGR